MKKNNAKTTSRTKRHNARNVSSWKHLFILTWFYVYLVLLCPTIAMNVKEQETMLKLKWPTIDAMNWNKNTSIKKWKSLSSTKNHRDKIAKQLISSSIMSSINNGTRIFSRHSKKMHKLLDHLRTDILKKLNKTDKHLKKSFRLTSNSPQL